MSLQRDAHASVPHYMERESDPEEIMGESPAHKKGIK